jgi:hypothetical protein
MIFTLQLLAVRRERDSAIKSTYLASKRRRAVESASTARTRN